VVAVLVTVVVVLMVLMLAAVAVVAVLGSVPDSRLSSSICGPSSLALSLLNLSL
jgi:hypothetical protein